MKRKFFCEHYNYEDNLLTHVRYADGSEKKFEYNTNGMMISEINKLGTPTTYTYNEWKRLLKVTRADNSFTSFIDGVSATVGNNFIGGVSGAMKSLTTDEIFDGVRDIKGIVTSLNRDEKGFVTKMTDSNGDIYQVERDLDGRPKKITRPDKTYTTFEYDLINHDLIKKYDSSINISYEYEYDMWGNLLEKNLANNESVSFSYDSNTGLLLNKILPLDSVESYEYYPNGLIKTKINALSQRASFVYGDYGNVVMITDNMGQVTQLTRDDKGNVLTSTNNKGQVITYSYDVLNRLLSVKTPKNEITSYVYLNSGELSKVIDPNSNETLYEYDIFGRLKKRTDPLGFVSELFYDSSGNLIKEIDPNGQIKSFEYDHLERLVKKILPDDIYEITYDERNNIKTVKNEHSLISYDYDHVESGEVVSRESVKGLGVLSNLSQATLEYDYDKSGNRVEMATPEGSFFYTYDKLNRLKKIINHKNENFDFVYDVGGRVTEQRSPVGITSYSYDNINSLSDISHRKKSNSSLISYFNFERDLIGNVSKLATSKGDATFSYDGNNQLINSNHPEFISFNVTYDSLGNRITDQHGNYVYDSKKQRLESDLKFNYVYDNNGNLLMKSSKAEPFKVFNYEYNSLNQLIFLKEIEGSSILKETKYYYDANGRRIVKDHKDMAQDSNSFTKRFIYDEQDILFELNEENDILAVYTHSKFRTDDVLAMDRKDKSYFYLKDHLGSIHDILDESGNLVQRYSYSDFGNIFKIENSSGATVTIPIVENFYTFTGRESDSESGLNYYRARYYDSGIGRFVSSDPHPGILSSPISLNSKYIYGNNDPINRVDPMGTFNIKKAFSFYLAIYNIYTSVLYINSDSVFSDKDTTRLTNAAIVSTAIAYGSFFSPGAAAVSTLGTAFSRRSKGNPLDNRQFATQFSVNFGISSALNYADFTSYTDFNALSISKDLALDAGITLGKEYIAKDLRSDHPSDRPLFGALLFSYYAFSPLLE